MQDGALHHTLEAAGRGGVDLALNAQALQLGVQISDDDVRKFTKINAARLHNLSCVGIVDERQQEMLKRRIFVRAVASMLQCVVKRGFQRLRKRWHNFVSLK